MKRVLHPTLAALLFLLTVPPATAIPAIPSYPLVARPARSSPPLAFQRTIGQGLSGSQFVTHLSGCTVFISTHNLRFVPDTVHRRPVIVQFRTPSAAGQLVPGDALAGAANYFVGSPRNWHRGIRFYGRVTVQNVYRGIDLILRGESGTLEYSWLVHPGASARQIQLAVQGGHWRLAGSRAEIVQGHTVVLVQEAMQAWQPGGMTVPVRYALPATGDLGIAPGRYHRRQALLIDPALNFSISFGGSSSDWASGVATDAAGNGYIVGSTLSGDYPEIHGTSGPHGTADDTVVTKLTPQGNHIVFSTFLGGSADDDGSAISVDPHGRVWVTGFTRSTDFPVVNAAGLPHHGSCAGDGQTGDTFISEFSPSGGHLLLSGCIGGSSTDWPAGIAATANGVYLAGSTVSRDFPTMQAWQQREAGAADIFLLHIVDGTVRSSTLFGGSGDDEAAGVSLDAQGHLWLTGSTNSTNFPVLHPLQAHYAGGSNSGPGSGDAFVSEFNASLQPLYSTYLGGSGDDQATGIAVDSQGGIYVAGETESADFPAVNAFQRTFAGNIDAFVSRLAPGGGQLSFSTFLGGAQRDIAKGIAATDGGAVVVGATSSADFPIKDAMQARYAGGYYEGDAFAAKLSTAGTLLYSSYLGGSSDDIATSVASKGTYTYLAGGTSSPDFPITTAIPGLNAQRGNAFLTRIADISPIPAASITIDEVSAFIRQGGNTKRTHTVHPNQRTLLLVVYHDQDVDADPAVARITFTAAGRALGSAVMTPNRIAGELTFTTNWRVPAGVQGAIAAQVDVTLGSAQATRILHLEASAG